MPKTKYLWATALVALCAVFIPVTAHAADSWTVAQDDPTNRTVEPPDLMDFPAGLIWDQVVGDWKWFGVLTVPDHPRTDVYLTAENNGSTDWGPGYDLRSVKGVGIAATLVDRWGLRLWPAVGVIVAPTETYQFDFQMVAPPITTLGYPLPVTPLTPGAVWPLDCNWMMSNAGTLITTDTAATRIAIGRFTDMVPYVRVTHDNIDADPERENVLSVMPSHWATFYVEECAGRIPYIVQGYPDGLYRPNSPVSRAYMAVYIRRAMKIPQLTPTVGTFPDVPDADPGPAHWAYGDIQALVIDGAGPGADVVGGYPDGNYYPDWLVTRAQMAVFVQRAKGYVMPTDTELNERYADWLLKPCTMNAATDTVLSTAHGLAINDEIAFGATTGGVTVGTTYYVVLVPTVDTFKFSATLGGPPFNITADGSNTWRYDVVWFTDVPVGYWADGEIYACVDNNVVQGYPDGLYRPTVNVDRGQMATYMYRAFIQPEGCAVVLAGPAATMDKQGQISSPVMYPDDQVAYGWSSTPVGDTLNMPYLYVAFDAARLDTNLAFGGKWDIEFKLLDPVTPTSFTNTVSLLPIDITNAKAAVDTESGVPYLTISWKPPSDTVPVGNYKLVVRVEDETGAMNELPRQPALKVISAAPRPPDVDDPGGLVWKSEKPVIWAGSAPDGARTPFSGTLADMATIDGNYYVTRRPTPGPYPAGCCFWDLKGGGETFVWHNVATDAVDITINVTYHVDVGTYNCQTWCAPPGWNYCSLMSAYWPDPLTNPHNIRGVWVLNWNTGTPYGWWYSSSDPLTRGEDDLHGGGDLGLPGFKYLPLVDESFTWTTTNAADFVSPTGDVVVHWCQMGVELLYIDKLTLEYTPAP